MKENCLMYHRRDVSDGSKEEPNESLINIDYIYISNQRRGSKPQFYLAPKEVTQTKRTAVFVKLAPAEQAKQHDEKQDCVSGQRDNPINVGNPCVGP